MTYIHKTIDAITGEEIEAPYTKAELDELKAHEEIDLEKARVRATKATAKAALLDKLGITAEEAALLLG